MVELEPVPPEPEQLVRTLLVLVQLAQPVLER
jgi:hypothetical protein